MLSEYIVLMVVSPKDFREEEYEVTRQRLEENGISVKVASLTAGECFGSNGSMVLADLAIADVSPADFSAVVFVGGPGTELLLGDQSVISLAKDFYQAEKLVCAICWAPAILARAGILNGMRATAWSGAREELNKSGSIFTGEVVTVSGNIITANGADAAEFFGDQIANALIG